MANKVAKYFLGESTPNGFKTYFTNEINTDGFYTYILKGGPGTGKSTLMKKIALEFSDKEDIEIYICSSDPHSFDAVLLKDSKIIVVDGTAPHVFDCKYPGVCQSIIDLGECWDAEILKENKEKIIAVINENAQWHLRCKKYISALASINSDIFSIGKMAVNSDKLKAFCGRFSKKYFPKTDKADGTVKYKKLSALTENGYQTHSFENYQNVFLMNDSYYAGTDEFLQIMCEIALSKGLDVIISENSLFNEPVFEHLLIPELSMAFIASNNITGIICEDAKVINFGRFYYKDIVGAKKQRIEFSKKAAGELMSEAASSLKNAKLLHDKIESYYIESVDFEKINKISDMLMQKIKSAY